jgi:hypothetical protein
MPGSDAASATRRTISSGSTITPTARAGAAILSADTPRGGESAGDGAWVVRPSSGIHFDYRKI